MSQVLLEFAVILVLLLANGALAMAEMALVSARKARLQTLAEAGSAAARRALEMAQSPNQFLSTVQIGITLIGILAGAFGGATLANWIAHRLVALGMHQPYAETAGIVLVVLTLTYLSLIVGELVPKRLALSAPERFACLLSGPLRTLGRIASPAVKLLGWSTEMLLRLIGSSREDAPQVSDEEVTVLMEEGQLAGVFHKAEPRMVERVLELDELLVKEIMTPRPKVLFVSADEPHDHLWPKLVTSHHSHFPVYQGNRDRVVGVLAIKSIYARLAAGQPIEISALMIPPLFVPAVQPVVELLESFRRSATHFAVVADEFGSVVGVVTLVDVLEAIVGDVPSQEERTNPQLRARDDGTWLADGALEIESLIDTLPGFILPAGEDAGYQTLAGFILDQLGHIPAEGETFTAYGWHFEIIDMDVPRIDKVLLRRASAGA